MCLMQNNHNQLPPRFSAPSPLAVDPRVWEFFHDAIISRPRLLDIQQIYWPLGFLFPTCKLACNWYAIGFFLFLIAICLNIGKTATLVRMQPHLRQRPRFSSFSAPAASRCWAFLIPLRQNEIFLKAIDLDKTIVDRTRMNTFRRVVQCWQNGLAVAAVSELQNALSKQPNVDIKLLQQNRVSRLSLSFCCRSAYFVLIATWCVELFCHVTFSLGNWVFQIFCA